MSDSLSSPQARILIAEDDANFGLVLKSFLAINGYEITLVPDGNQAYSAFRRQHFDLAIFDVMMPYRDGFTLAEAVQQLKADVPFIFLTAKALKEDQIRGYRLGALDYLVKPFDPEILLLKIQALLARTQPSAAPVPTQPHRLGSFVFDPHKRQLLLEGRTQKLSPKENDLLDLLCQKEGDILTREEALVKIWQEDSYFTAQSMNVYVTRLRKYLKQDPHHRIEITNLHGKGFVLEVA